MFVIFAPLFQIAAAEKFIPSSIQLCHFEQGCRGEKVTFMNVTWY